MWKVIVTRGKERENKNEDRKRISKLAPMFTWTTTASISTFTTTGQYMQEYWIRAHVEGRMQGCVAAFNHTKML